MYEGLAGFLTSYLHLDWDVEFDSPIDAARHFANNGKLDDLVTVIGEIALITAGPENEQRVSTLLSSTMCGYVPADGECARWLSSLGSQIAQVAAARFESVDGA